jgi:hypothetical protein
VPDESTFVEYYAVLLGVKATAEMPDSKKNCRDATCMHGSKKDCKI